MSRFGLFGTSEAFGACLDTSVEDLSPCGWKGGHTLSPFVPSPGFGTGRIAEVIHVCLVLALDKVFPQLLGLRSRAYPCTRR